MRVRFALSLVAGIAGVGLLIAAATVPNASSSTLQQRGGTLRVDERSDFDFVDPALSFFSHSLRLQYTTCAKLLNYPDREGAAGTRLVPEIARSLPSVSRDGRTYTFPLRTTYRFNTGAPVRAADVVATFLRSRQSPYAAPFMRDIASVRAAGATRVRFRLRAPRGDFLARVAMPFFCVLPAGTPYLATGLEPPIPSAGPYFLASWDKGRTAVLERNPNYRGPRLRNPDRIVFNIGIALDSQQARCERGDSDICAFPPAQAEALADRYGVNRGRFFAKTQLVTWFLAFNEQRPLFRNNDRLERAINYALDRPQMVRQHGAFGGSRTDQLLPPGLPGFRNWNLYPLSGVDLARARALASGATRDGKAILWTFSASFGPAIAQVVQFNLRQIGLDVEIVVMDRVVQLARAREPGAPYDILLNGLGASYLDPASWYGHALGAMVEQESQNFSKFTDARWRRRIAAATRMRPGAARLRTWSLLERDILRGPAPIAPYVNTNARFLVSARTRCVVFHPLHQMNLNAACVA